MNSYSCLHQSHKQYPLLYYNQSPCNSQGLTENKINEMHKNSRNTSSLFATSAVKHSITGDANMKQGSTEWKGSPIKPLPRLRASTVLHSNLTKPALCFTKPLYFIPSTGYPVKNMSSTFKSSLCLYFWLGKMKKYLCFHYCLHTLKKNSKLEFLKFTCYSVISIFSFLNKSLFSLWFYRKNVLSDILRHMQNFRSYRQSPSWFGLIYTISAKKQTQLTSMQSWQLNIFASP